MTLTELVALAYEQSKEKGFHDEPRSALESIALIHSELSEAVEELRQGYEPNEVYTPFRKPEGFPVELADAVIRIADLCGEYGIDLEKMVELKLEYNMTRPFKHGKKC